MKSCALRITLARKTVPELLGRVSVRVWHGLGVVPDWFRHGLESARPCLGYGVIEPLELRLSDKEMVTVTASAGVGTTLLEHLHPTSSPYSSDAACGLIQQLCIGVLRIHEGQESVHGGLNPFNIHRTDDGELLLWSVPTSRLELSFGDMDEEWETPYRSPQVRERDTPTMADDVYSLGKLLLRLLCRDQQQFDTWEQAGFEGLGASNKTASIVEQCLHPERANRYISVRDLAADLDSESAALQLDIAGAKQDKSLALSAFREERFEEALEHWQDALRKDWLDLTTRNNIAITKGAIKSWEEALSDLNKAHDICKYHPLVDSNIGYCHYKLGDTEAAGYWQERARKLNPGFSQATLRIAEMNQSWGRFKPALKWTFDSLHANPKCQATRLLAAELLEAMGNKEDWQRHRAYAKSLPPSHPLWNSLITEQTPPPWSLVFESNQGSVLERYQINAIGPDRFNISRHLLHKALNRPSKFGDPQDPNN